MEIEMEDIRVDARDIEMAQRILDTLGVRLDGDETSTFARQLEYVKAQTFDISYAKLKALMFIPLDETADPGIVADLTAIRLADPDWYGLGLDSNSKAEVEAAAAWAEAEQIIFGSNTADTEVVQGLAGNVQLVLQAAAYERTYSI